MSLSRDQLLVLWTINILERRRDLSEGLMGVLIDFWSDVTPRRSWS